MQQIWEVGLKVRGSTPPGGQLGGEGGVREGEGGRERERRRGGGGVGRGSGRASERASEVDPTISLPVCGLVSIFGWFISCVQSACCT